MDWSSSPGGVTSNFMGLIKSNCDGKGKWVETLNDHLKWCHIVFSLNVISTLHGILKGTLRSSDMDVSKHSLFREKSRCENSAFIRARIEALYRRNRFLVSKSLLHCRMTYLIGRLWSLQRMLRISFWILSLENPQVLTTSVTSFIRSLPHFYVTPL